MVEGRRFVKHKRSPETPFVWFNLEIDRVLQLFLILVIHGIITTLAGTDTIGLFNRPDEDLAITHFTGIS